MLELACGLSAWKPNGVDSWALRNNPSSGNLNPTETYLIIWQNLSNKIGPGIYHFAPNEHGLELRHRLPEKALTLLTTGFSVYSGAIGFSSILWCEAWKYGELALRYCQHDVRDALASLAYSCTLLGWKTHIDDSATDPDIRAALGLSQPCHQAEIEQPDALMLIGKTTDVINNGGAKVNRSKLKSTWSSLTIPGLRSLL